MEILVTGGAGFIGSNIVDALIKAGHQVIIVDNLSSGKKKNINKLAKFYQIDLCQNDLARVFQENKITHVIHHAAQIDVQASIENPLFDARNNILGTLNLLENCREFAVEKVIYASSAAVYGEPDYLPVDEKHPLKIMSGYGISKHTPEHYLKVYQELYGINYTIFRYANVYGPRQDPAGEGGVVSIFVDQMLAGKRPVIFGDGSQSRDFIHVYDIVKANLLALSKGNNLLINLSTESRSSIKELVKYLNKILAFDLKPIYKPARSGDILHSVLANSQARQILGWQPEYDLLSGLEQTINYYKKLN